jgi:hypothetical protein
MGRVLKRARWASLVATATSRLSIKKVESIANDPSSIRSLIRYPCFGTRADRMPRQERERFSATIKPCATSTPIELIWLSEISDSSAQILEQIEIPVNPDSEKWLTPVPFSLRRPMAAHLLSESPFIFRRSAPYDRESLGSSSSGHLFCDDPKKSKQPGRNAEGIAPKQSANKNKSKGGVVPVFKSRPAGEQRAASRLARSRGHGIFRGC